MASDKKRILIVDDEYNYRLLLEKALRTMFYDCYAAASGLTALEMLNKQDFDLLLLDINLPDKSGIEILREIKSLKEELPIVMITGYTAVDLVRLTMREGAYDYLQKPWSYDDLKFTVHRAIEYGMLAREKKQHQENLEIGIQERTREAQQVFSEIKETYRTTLF